MADTLTALITTNKILDERIKELKKKADFGINTVKYRHVQSIEFNSTVEGGLFRIVCEDRSTQISMSDIKIRGFRQFMGVGPKTDMTDAFKEYAGTLSEESRQPCLRSLHVALNDVLCKYDELDNTINQFDPETVLGQFISRVNKKENKSNIMVSKKNKTKHNIKFSWFYNEDDDNSSLAGFFDLLDQYYDLNPPLPKDDVDVTDKVLNSKLLDTNNMVNLGGSANSYVIDGSITGTTHSIISSDAWARGGFLTFGSN